MSRQSTIKQPSSSLPTSLSLQNIVVDLEPQYEGSISGGSEVPYLQADWLISHASRPPISYHDFPKVWYEYIYLPGLKRTRRIVGREREGIV
jgi:hypothetical protein